MNRIFFLSITGMMMFGMPAYTPAQTSMPAETSTDIPVTDPSTMSSTPANVYTGVYVSGSPGNMSYVSTFENDAKKKVSIVIWYQQWGATDGTQNFQNNWMNNVRNNGSIPEVTWMPCDQSGNVNQSQFTLKSIINGNHDAYITNWALASKAWGHPYFLRFAHEMNGNWYPWSEQANGNSSGQFIQAWNHVRSIFAKNGVTNVTWVWSPNVEYNGSISLKELYPGNSEVDWVGIDGYNWGTSQPGKSWQSFAQVFAHTYNDITGFTSKPLMVAETASTELGGSKSAWITDAYSTQIPYNFPKIRAVTWFNQNKETDWRIESSHSAQSSFSSAMQNGMYQNNHYGAISQTPISLP